MPYDLIPQDLYNQILTNMPIPCVDFCLVSQGMVLLVLRKDAPAKNEWWVPGGRILKGEKMQETAARKCKEELGIECFVGPIVYTAETIFPDGPSEIPVHSINSCFLTYPKDNQNIILDNHHKDFKWVNTIDYNLNDYVIECLKGAGLR